MNPKIRIRMTKYLPLKFLLPFAIALYSTISFATIEDLLAVDNKSQNTSSFIGIAAGTYSISLGPFYPFIATGNFCSGAPCNAQLPLVALSANKDST